MCIVPGTVVHRIVHSAPAGMDGAGGACCAVAPVDDFAACGLASAAPVFCNCACREESAGACFAHDAAPKLSASATTTYCFVIGDVSVLRFRGGYSTREGGIFIV